MTEHRIVARETITEDSVEHRETLRKDYAPGAPHGDEEAGGAVAGGVAGAVVGAVVVGPVGAAWEDRIEQVLHSVGLMGFSQGHHSRSEGRLFVCAGS